MNNSPHHGASTSHYTPSTASSEAKNPSTSTLANVKIFNFEKVARKERRLRKHKPENLIRRAGGLKKRKDLKYEDFERLYSLWSDYFRVLIGSGENVPDERLVRADYHGALLRVHSAPNPAQIGLHGIVVHESKFTFQMITRKNCVIVIPKEGATFQFALAGRVFTLFGDALRQKSFQRGRKQRAQLTLPFLLS